MVNGIKKLFALALIVSVFIATVPLTALAEINEWTSSGPSNAIVCGLAVSPNFSSDKTIFAATNGTGVYKSVDEGLSWTQCGLSGGHVLSIAISPDYASDNTIFAGTTGGVYVSTNNGSTWGQASLANESINALAVSPFFASDGTVFAGADGVGLYKTTDKGNSWNPVDLPNANVSSIAISPAYSSDGTVLVATSDKKGVFKSENRGDDWIPFTAGIEDTAIQSLAVTPDFATSKTVFADKFKSTDGGQTWNAMGPIDSVIFSLAVSPGYAVDSTILAGTYTKGVFKSIDGGDTWQQIISGLTNLSVPSVALTPTFLQDSLVYAGTWGGGVFNCSTRVDLRPPIIASTDPVNNAIGVSKSKTITINFNENIAAGAAYGLISLKAGTQAVSFNKSITNRTLTIDPSSDFSNDTTYTLVIPDNAIQDTAGVPLTAQRIITFSTQDGIAPTVASTDPAHNATGIAKGKDILVTFSENIFSGSNFNNITVKNSSNSAIGISRSTSGRVLTINPDSNLNYSTQYTVRIPAGSIRDATGNALMSDYDFRFTAQSDNVAPVVTGTTPTDAATNIDVNSSVVVLFDENIYKGTAYDNTTIKDPNGNQVATTLLHSNKELKITPKNSLAAGTTYTVSIPSNAIRDSLTNSFATRYTFSFKTRTDSTAPSAPKNLRQTSAVDSMRLNWDANSEADMAGYNIYRRARTDSNFKKLNSSIIGSASYTDGNASLGVSYLYYVTAVDRSGNESKSSNEIGAAVTNVKAEVIFSDVPSSAWYTTYVNRLLSLKILGGYSNGTFLPNRMITRAEFCKALVLAMGWQLESPSAAAFADVSKNDWSYTYVETAVKKGVINGYQGNEFRPNEYIMRGEIARMIAIALNLTANSTALTDTGNHWARNQIGSCIKAGIVSGYPNNTFRPDNSATRSEAAKMIVKTMDKR